MAESDAQDFNPDGYGYDTEIGDELNDFINKLPKIPTNTGPGNTDNPNNNNSGPGNTDNPNASVTNTQNINLDVAINGSGGFTPEQNQAIANEIKKIISNGIEVVNDGTNIDIIFNYG